MIGTSQRGKSTSLINQALEIIAQDQGLALIDPHRETAEKLLRLIPAGHHARVIYADFEDPQYCLCHNAFDEDDQANFGRLAVELVNSFKLIMDASSFHRMTHILGMASYALIELKHNLTSLPVLLSKTAQGERLRKKVARKTENEAIASFCSDGFHDFSKDAIAPIINRISTLLIDDNANRIFSQVKSKLKIDEVMNHNKILIVALPRSPDVSSFIGSTLIAQFQKAALNRISTPSAQNPFFLFIDEFPRLLAGAPIIESMINECAKANLHVSLSHQESGQISKELFQAALSIPNIMLFGLNLLDARRLAPVFAGKVSVDDILALDVGEVYARIDGAVVDFKCPPPPEYNTESASQEIIGRSRKAYYVPMSELEKEKKKIRRAPRQFDTFD